MSERYVVDQHWYMTQDRKRVVEENNPDGYWLWAAPGQIVDRSEAERLGAIKPDPHAAKQAPPAANKMAPSPANKAR